jgi:pyrimidine operon attenuation protein/uracil phosphoribosyltransferase
MAQSASALLDADSLARALDEIARRVSDEHTPGRPIALVGIRSRGVPLAARLAERLRQRFSLDAAVGAIDITLYRDDLGQIARAPVLRGTHVPFAVDGVELVLVDDVLFTGRTIRAAMDVLCDLGRPAAIRLAVLVDRGHRELPIQADYCGLRVETTRNERIEVRLRETDGIDEVRKESLHPGTPGDD